MVSLSALLATTYILGSTLLLCGKESTVVGRATWILFRLAPRTFQRCDIFRWAKNFVNFSMAVERSPQRGRPRPQPKPYIIGNGAVEIGVNLDLGGSIGYLRALMEGGDAIATITYRSSHSQNKHRLRNVINSADKGREIQMSFYAPPRPYIPNEASTSTEEDCSYSGKAWPWNPIGAGNVHGDTSKILNVTKLSNSSLSILTRPLQWACTPEPVQCECTFEKTIQVHSGNRPVIKVTARLHNARTDAYDESMRMNQELPAVYTNGFLYRLVTYSGSKPFQSDSPVTEFNASFDADQPFPWIPGQFSASEHWGAFVDEDGWGLGVINPKQATFVGGFFRPEKKGQGGPRSSQTGYIAPVGMYALPRNVTFEYVYYLVLGSVDYIRSVAKSVVMQHEREKRYASVGGKILLDRS